VTFTVTYDLAVVSDSFSNLTEIAAGKQVSIGIIAWNEEHAIRALLDSLFRQSLFAELNRRNLQCEIVCLANGCTDRTAAVADELLAEAARSHPHAAAFSGRALSIRERGKINAWNLFVHSTSARESEFLFLLDADIVLGHPETLWNMLLTLQTHAEANIAVDKPCKDIELKSHRTWRDRLSLVVSRQTRSAAAQLCGQLYCIRAAVARNIYLPRDLTACDDGLIKALVCTDFLAHGVWPMRIQLARNAAHTFEAYTTLKSVFKNQKRQVIGQTLVHILVDLYLKNLPPWQRSKLADTLREKERKDPGWLKQLVTEHLNRTRYCWQLYPGLLTHRFKSLKTLNLFQKLASLPVVLLGCAITLAASFAALRFLKTGYTDYWPRAERSGREPFRLSEPIARLGALKINPE
jgi:glycosyltransferase involved in cell wall biosynthesis